MLESFQNKVVLFEELFFLSVCVWMGPVKSVSHMMNATIVGEVMATLVHSSVVVSKFKLCSSGYQD